MLLHALSEAMPIEVSPMLGFSLFSLTRCLLVVVEGAAVVAAELSEVIRTFMLLGAFDFSVVLVDSLIWWSSTRAFSGEEYYC
jgi:hypothetical protein